MDLTRVPEIHTGMLRDDTRFVCLVGTEDACGEARVQGVDHRRMVRPTNTAQPRPSTRRGFVGCVQDPQRIYNMRRSLLDGKCQRAPQVDLRLLRKRSPMGRSYPKGSSTGAVPRPLPGESFPCPLRTVGHDRNGRIRMDPLRGTRLRRGR